MLGRATGVQTPHGVNESEAGKRGRSWPSSHSRLRWSQPWKPGSAALGCHTCGHCPARQPGGAWSDSPVSRGCCGCYGCSRALPWERDCLPALILASRPRPQPLPPQVRPGCHTEAATTPSPHWLQLLPAPSPPPPGLPHERGSVSLPLCLHMNLGWECRSVGPGILVLLTFALRIRGAWASRDNPCVFFSGQLKGESGYFQGLSSGTGWLYLPWRVATCRVSGCREAPVNSQGRLGAALCVPPQEDVCVRVRDRVCKSVCMCEGVCWGRRIPLFLGIP